MEGVQIRKSNAFSQENSIVNEYIMNTSFKSWVLKDIEIALRVHWDRRKCFHAE